jgi:hypothetical protein
LLPRREPLAVGVERRQVGGDVDAVAGLGIDEPEVALELGVELVGREDVEDDQLRPRRGQLADDAIRGQVEEVRDQHDDAAAGELRRRVPCRRDEVRRALGRLDRRQARQQPEHPARAAERRLAPARPPAERADRDTILRGEADVAERSRRPLSEQQLLRPAAGH